MIIMPIAESLLLVTNKGVEFIILILCSVISLILMITYMRSRKKEDINITKKDKIVKILFILYLIGMFLIITGTYSLISMESKGLDSLGEAIVYGFMIAIGSCVTLFTPIIILFIDYWKQIFRIKTLIIVLLLVGVYILIYILYISFTTTKVSENIPTLGTFQEELTERKLYSEMIDYKLYGINKDNCYSLSFKNAKDVKYPLYVYVLTDWIIYYANGDIYAVYGDLLYDYISWNYPITVLSENEEITIYNRKLNRYKKTSNNILSSSYYPENSELDITGIKLPAVYNDGANITQIDRLDKENINKYVKDNSESWHTSNIPVILYLDGTYEIVVSNYNYSNDKIFVSLETSSNSLAVFMPNKDKETYDDALYSNYSLYIRDDFSEESMKKIYATFSKFFSDEYYNKMISHRFNNIANDDTTKILKGIIEDDESYILDTNN